jgi:hypothetical protein
MDEAVPTKRKAYHVVLRLWFFLIFAMLLVVTLFRVHLPLCGDGGAVQGQKLTLRDYVTLLGSNAAVAAAVVRIRSRLLFIMSTFLALVAADWLLGHLLSIPMR